MIRIRIAIPLALLAMLASCLSPTKDPPIRTDGFSALPHCQLCDRTHAQHVTGTTVKGTCDHLDRRASHASWSLEDIQQSFLEAGTNSANRDDYLTHCYDYPEEMAWFLSYYRERVLTGFECETINGERVLAPASRIGPGIVIGPFIDSAREECKEDAIWEVRIIERLAKSYCDESNSHIAHVLYHTLQLAMHRQARPSPFRTLPHHRDGDGIRSVEIHRPGISLLFECQMFPDEEVFSRVYIQSPQGGAVAEYGLPTGFFSAIHAFLSSRSNATHIVVRE